jgi:hypothetical protein
MKSYKRSDCRLCGQKQLSLVLKLTPTPPADSFIPKEQLNSIQDSIPLELYLCSDCGHTQLGHVIDGEEVYLNYIYETVSTLGLGDHFKDCVNTVMDKYLPKAGGLVLDIGSNDGIMLKYFKEHGMDILGIDPMPGIAKKASANGVPTLPYFFNLEYAKGLREKYGVPSVISSNNLVADTDDLTGFISGVKELMDKDSIFFFETFYLYLQINNNVWDFTYHEHYSYFTVKPLEKYFESMGMELIDVTPNLTKGGSMRCVVQLKGGNRKQYKSVQEHIELENNEGFHSKTIFDKYSTNIEKGKQEYLDLIRKLKEEGKTLVGYGASATSTTLMYHYEMDGTLDYLVDDFSAKHDLYSPGLHVPVFPSDEIYNNKPDYIVILAWRYHEKILKKHQKFLDQGGHFIIPLPELKIV